MVFTRSPKYKLLCDFEDGTGDFHSEVAELATDIHVELSLLIERLSPEDFFNLITLIVKSLKSLNELKLVIANCNSNYESVITDNNLLKEKMDFERNLRLGIQQKLLALEDAIASFEIKIKGYELEIEELKCKLSKNNLTSENLQCDTLFDNFDSYNTDYLSKGCVFSHDNVRSDINVRRVTMDSFIHPNYSAIGCQISSLSRITKVHVLADSHLRGIA